MTLVRSTSMMNAGRSAAYGAGDFSSCAYFQSCKRTCMMISLGTMILVPIFVIFALVVLCGALARICPAAFLIFLAAALIFHLNTPERTTVL